MYGPNYSGFAFHPKTVRMVGPVHLVDFFGRPAELCGDTCFGGAAATSRTLPGCAQSRSRQRFASAAIACTITAFSIELPVLIPCAVWVVSLEHCHLPAALVTGLPLVAPALVPTPDSPTHRPLSENKNGVFHVKHAARFLPTARTIKPFSSPTPGMFRSRAGSVPVRPPALPARTPPSPTRSRSPRSAVPRVRSARSTASRRLCRVTR